MSGEAARGAAVSRVLGAWTLLVLLAGCNERSVRVFRDAADDGVAASDRDGAIDAEIDRVGAADGTSVSDLVPAACVGDQAGGVENAACNEIVPAGPCVDQLQIDDSAPAPGGGPLVAGTYDLTERILYTNPGGATGSIGEPKQETLVLSPAGSTWVLTVASRSANGSRRQTQMVTVVGSSLAFVVVCPSPAAAGDGGSDGDDTDGADDGDGAIEGPADATVDSNSPDRFAGADAAGVAGGGGYYTASDLTLTLYGLSASGPVRADTYTRR